MPCDPWINTLIVAEYPGHRAFVHSVKWSGTMPTVRTTPDESSAMVLTSTEADALVNRLHNALHVWEDDGRTQARRTDICPGVQCFATIGILRPWLAVYRPHAKARKPQTIGPYFARTEPAARRYALDVLDRDHEGAELIELRLTTDPRP